MNLRGVEKSDLKRGDVLGLPGVWHPTTLIDAWLRYLPGAHLPLEHDDPVKLFVGAAEVAGRVRVLDRERVLPGEESWIQIRLETPLVAARGDRYIIRRASPPETIGGGVILDTAPGQRWKRFRPDVMTRFETLRGGDPLEIALLELARTRGPVRRETLPLTSGQLDRALAAGQMRTMGEWVMHSQAWARLADKTARILANFHAAEPLRLGMPREALRSRLRLDPEPFEVILGALAGEEIVTVERNGAVRLPDHRVQLSETQQNALGRLWQEFERAPHTPPTAAQAREIVGDAVFNRPDRTRRTGADQRRSDPDAGRAARMDRLFAGSTGARRTADRRRAARSFPDHAPLCAGFSRTAGRARHYAA